MNPRLLSSRPFAAGIIAALLATQTYRACALPPTMPDGSPRPDCSGAPGAAVVQLQWRGQNLVGCKVEILSSLTKIHFLNRDCTTISIFDLPPDVPQQWSILSQPAGANASLTPSGNLATLTLPAAGDYVVGLTVCPGNDCTFTESPGSTPLPLFGSSGSITITAVAQMPLDPPSTPMLPPSALVPANRLGLSDGDRYCMCQGGGGVLSPQWVTVTPWNGPNDYRLLEGTAEDSWISIGDDPLNHSLIFGSGGLLGSDFYIMNDINMRVGVDPQFRSLVSTSPEDPYNPFAMGCEVENWQIPERFRPFPGDRVSVWGFWNLDCGHTPYYTEIHPVVGWAVHRERPVRLPDNATFTFDFLTNQVSAPVGTGLYVPGIASDLWFSAHTGEITVGDDTGLAQPAACNPAFPACGGNVGACPPFLGGDSIVGSPIQRFYEFNIYLPKNPAEVFAAIGLVRPRAPLYVNISNPYGYPGPDPTYSLMTETVNGVAHQYLHVYLDLRNYPYPTYSRHIDAAWVYPAADNWGLEQWRVSLTQMIIYNALDLFGPGDWHMWLMLPGMDQAWTKIMDGFGNTADTINFSPPWTTGAADDALQRGPLQLDPAHRLGSDLLLYNGGFMNVFMTGFESDGPLNDDPGRGHNVMSGEGSFYVVSNNENYKAALTSQKIATLNNGVLSPTAAAFAQQFLLVCTNKVPGRQWLLRSLLALDSTGMLSPGISPEDPWVPSDPQNVLGNSAALLGDANQDGVPDVVLGAGGTNFEARLFLGSQTGFSPAPFTTISMGIPATTGLGTFNERTRTLTGVGDVNGDGVPDLLVAAPYFSNNGVSHQGAAMLFSGAQLGAGGAFGYSNALWLVQSGVTNAEFGYAVAAAGDINGDGYADVVIGAPNYPNGPLAPLGRVFVYFGSSNGLAAFPQQVLIPPSTSNSLDWFGYSVAGAGDVNHDGYLDVLVGAPRYSHTQTNQGAILLYYGSPTGLVLNASVLVEGDAANAQFGYAVAGAGDVDGDGYGDVLAGAPYHSGTDSQPEQGLVSWFRGSATGLITTPAGGWYGYNFSHFGSDLAGVGDLNGDGYADVAVVAPDDQNQDGVRGRVAYFLGSAGGLAGTQTWDTWGASGVAKRPPGKLSASDINLDGFDDVLTYDPQGVGLPCQHVQLILGRGQKKMIPATDDFFAVSTASGDDEFALDNVLSPNFGALLSQTGQTNRTKLALMAGKLRDLLVSNRVGGGNPANFVPFLLGLQQALPPDIYSQYFGDVDLDLGAAWYIDCGETQQYHDAIGRLWLSDVPFLTSTATTYTATLAGTGITVSQSLLGDRFIPQQMLQSERWCDGDIRYQFPVPNNWYTVILYFSENCSSCVGPALGGTSCSTCARVFDLEVQGQLLNAYNQADAALPPNGDGLGALYTATQVSFTAQVTNGILNVAVLDRGQGDPPENAAIKGIAILMRPPPGKLATKPAITSYALSGIEPSLLVDLKANWSRFLAGELGVHLQYSGDLRSWRDLPNLPGYQFNPNGASFLLLHQTNTANFFRAVVTSP